MKRIVISRPGGVDRLSLEESADLVPGPGELLVEVDAIGVNYADCVTRMGLYASARRYEGYPMTPGFEVAGRVGAWGEGATGFDRGQAVLAVTRFRGYATQVVVPAGQVYPVPRGMTLPQAAAVSAVSLTAWYALFELAHPHRDDTLLVHSAAGGVGSILVQLGKLLGCRVVGVVGAAHKVDAVRAVGADHVIDKSTLDLWREAESIAPDGYDVILDANGVLTLRQSYRHLAAAGKLVVYGFHGMLPRKGGRPYRISLALDYLRTPRFSPFDLTGRNRSVLGFNLSYLFDRQDLLRPGMERLLGWYEQGQLRVPMVTTYPLAEVAQAHRDLESGETVGKLVLVTT